MLHPKELQWLQTRSESNYDNELNQTLNRFVEKNITAAIKPRIRKHGKKQNGWKQKKENSSVSFICNQEQLKEYYG